MKTWLRYFFSLCGINLVIFVHELGHYVACKLYQVPTPVFSIGFGPKVVGTTIGNTLFQIALLPIGGYVSIAETLLSKQPFSAQAVIILAGIVFNLIFGFFLLWITKQAGHVQELQQLAASQDRGFIGPFGIMRIMSDSLLISAGIFWRILGVLSINIGIFNALPIPFFDGGQLVVAAINAMDGTIPTDAANWVYGISLVLLLLFLIYITFRDILRK